MVATMAREQVLDLLKGLPAESLGEVARFIEFLRFRSAQDAGAPVDTHPPGEEPLLAIVHRHLPPEDQRRLSALRALKEERALTPEEHAELLSYVDRVEREDAERAQALLDLSRLRGVSLGALLTDLGLSADA
jgi:hypothetical protein